ncbi:hypothetical protein KZZ08_18470 [Roseovarius mucosus]|uniref:hypothetical protein n=1 Tax=Roseovarius mucosus TaxID=215743 RepID=UPI001C600A89|nr:hypothetical protein [Roseovarius mucosus]MBW4975619.1 hypothetical protein [Roseovarius mucosus]
MIHILVSGLVLFISIFLSWALFLTLRQSKAEAVLKRELKSLELAPRQIYADSVIVITNRIPVFAGGRLKTRVGSETSLEADPLVALFLFVNELGADALDGLTLDVFLRDHMKSLTIKKLGRLEFFVAAAEFGDVEFQKARRIMIRKQREAADAIRSNWRGRLSRRVETVAQAATERDSMIDQKQRWSQERVSPVADAALTDWLRVQGPDMWHEVCITVAWSESGAAGLVPFVEWLVEQPDLDRASALLLLAKAVLDAIDSEPYEQHNCARNQAWMKIIHDRILAQSDSPMRFSIPQAERADVEAFFSCGTKLGWPVPETDLDPAGVTAHQAAYTLVKNRPVESFAAWKARVLT